MLVTITSLLSFCGRCAASIRAFWSVSIPLPSFADITARFADKGTGLVSIAEHQGFDVSETMAFGDGGNDTSIIMQAGIGVAMGNANEHLKLVADYITSSVDDDGVYNALKHFGII